MTRIYFYKLVADNGGAPCVKDGLLSLAICKPMIRRKADEDDWIFGFAANSLFTDNRLIYIARVTEKVIEGKYYEASRFSGRGDCIYARKDGRFEWRQGALHHGPEHLAHDLGDRPEYERASVLLSNDFRYFGANGTDDFKSRFPLVRDAVEALGRGYRVVQSDELNSQFMKVQAQAWKESHRKVVGNPTSEPQRSVCHRTKSCGVLTANP